MVDHVAICLTHPLNSVRQWCSVSSPSLGPGLWHMFKDPIGKNEGCDWPVCLKMLEEIEGRCIMVLRSDGELVLSSLKR